MRNIIFLIVTIVLFGVSAFFRKLSVDRIHPYQLQIVAGLVYAIEIPIWLYLINKQQISNYNSTGVMYTALCIVSHVIAAVLFGILLKTSNNTGAMATMVAMNPIVTTLLSVLILGENFTLKKGVATGIMLAGLALFNF
jgi:uncharacterized membrane protein